MHASLGQSWSVPCRCNHEHILIWQCKGARITTGAPANDRVVLHQGIKTLLWLQSTAIRSPQADGEMSFGREKGTGGMKAPLRAIFAISPVLSSLQMFVNIYEHLTVLLQGMEVILWILEHKKGPVGKGPGRVWGPEAFYEDCMIQRMFVQLWDFCGFVFLMIFFVLRCFFFFLPPSDYHITLIFNLKDGEVKSMSWIWSLSVLCSQNRRWWGLIACSVFCVNQKSKKGAWTNPVAGVSCKFFVRNTALRTSHIAVVLVWVCTSQQLLRAHLWKVCVSGSSFLVVFAYVEWRIALNCPEEEMSFCVTMCFLLKGERLD